METKKKKKSSWQQYIGMVFFMVIGAVCGVLMVQYVEKTEAAAKGIGEVIMSLVVLFLIMYIAIFLNIVIHEAGHLVFGLATGYKFCSFRIGSLMWMKENEKIRLKRLSLAGTGGQCLMSPPKYGDGKFPVVLYNLGGSLFNVFAGIICLVLYLPGKGENLFSAAMFLFAVVGFVLALMNGIPLRMGMVDNDGYNALSLGKNPEALRSFWIQMKMSEQFAKGIRIKDLPMEWFVYPSKEGRQNNLVAALAVFACNRLMDEQRFEQAYKQMTELLEEDNAVTGLHRSLLICDCIYCEAVGENRREIIDKMLDKQLKSFMNSMKNYPSVLRTQYVYALLVEQDKAEADKVKEKFLQCAKTYPYASEIDSEQELMDIADELAKGVEEPQEKGVWIE